MKQKQPLDHRQVVPGASIVTVDHRRKKPLNARSTATYSGVKIRQRRRFSRGRSTGATGLVATRRRRTAVRRSVTRPKYGDRLRGAASRVTSVVPSRHRRLRHIYPLRYG